MFAKLSAEFIGTFWLVLGAVEARYSRPLFPGSASVYWAFRWRSVSPY